MSDQRTVRQKGLQMIYPVNAHLVPKNSFADYPDRPINDAAGAGMIVSRFFKNVLFDGMTVTDARNTLWTYHDREMMLAAFDRSLMQHLNDCDHRPSPVLL
jgi:hypothetical protein